MQREIPCFAGLPAPKDAADKTLRLCDTEQDAIAVSIVLSSVSQAEIARRMGVSVQLVSAWKSGERVLTDRRTAMFCTATGTNLVRQWRVMQAALREASGQPRASDRIAAIAAWTAVATPNGAERRAAA